VAAVATELRKTGISVVGDLLWGAHVCHFYETKQDMLDTLIPYFKAGLENNEFCLWVISEPLTAEEARQALGQAVPELDRYLAERRIEILPHHEWYLKEGAFDLHTVIAGCEAKLAEALARGYAGLRFTGDTSWIQKEDWEDFRAYEKELGGLIAHQRMSILCTYSLAKSAAADILDVASIHQVAVAMRNGHQEIVETPAHKQAKAEIKRLNDELEQRVVERTRELAATNEELRREIAERKHAEDALRESAARFRRYFELGLIGMAITSPTKGMIEVNDQFCEILGYERSELLQMTWAEMTHPDDLCADVTNFNRVIAGEIDGYSMDKRFIRKDGQIIHGTIAVKCLRRADGSVDYCAAMMQDITKRKRVEEQFRASSEQLRALSISLNSAREEEGMRIARELHDELGSALTSLKWDMEGIDKLCAEAANPTGTRKLREKIETMTGLIDATLDTVKRISSELRPGILDDLGLVAAIEWQAQQFQSRSGILTQFDSLIETNGFSREYATAIFRIFKEALTNILRHAQATRVNVILEEEEGEFVLEVNDNGRGITEAETTAPGSLGLIGMRERAHLVGGRIEISGVAGRGTGLALRVPLPRPAAD
jgi:PAS domain S-box-containing protein